MSIAIARLGDIDALGELHQRLSASADQADRVAVLYDCLYVGNVSLTAYFGPVLHDNREIVALSIPENPPMEYARVANIALHIMAQLGIKFSFPINELKRLSPDQLDEARERVQAQK